jgi:hypothetical protein
MELKLMVLIAEGQPPYRYTNSICSRALPWASESNTSQYNDVKTKLPQVLEKKGGKDKRGKTHSKQFMVGFWAFSQC